MHCYFAFSNSLYNTILLREYMFNYFSEDAKAKRKLFPM